MNKVRQVQDLCSEELKGLCKVFWVHINDTYDNICYRLYINVKIF